jgi:hypothetical protein
MKKKYFFNNPIFLVLELLYPGKHSLALKHEGNLYEASLELEL